MIKKLRNYIRGRNAIRKAIFQISKWQYSRSYPLRWFGKIFSAFFFTIYGDRYYTMLAAVYKSSLQQSGRPVSIASWSVSWVARFFPSVEWVRLLTGDSRFGEADYANFLMTANLSAERRFQWAQHLMSTGRLDLARAGFKDLTERATTPQFSVRLEERFHSLRYLGIVQFLLGNNREANECWRLGGMLRKIMHRPTTPRRYRILGEGWRAAIGHVAMLDYYLKYQRLYFNESVRIVAPWKIEQIPSPDLLEKFSSLGITCISPDDLETDYNRWSAEQHFSRWNTLSPEEKAALVDDFWSFDFPDGEILGFAHAIARIQSEWEAQHPPLFVLTNQDKRYIADLLALLGVPPGAWYVCLHVREAGYHQQWNSLYPSMRDANIDDYRLAIEEIVKAGGWVLRMGDPSMKPLPPMPNVIDYAHSSFKSPQADIMLAAGCRFLLGTNSGFANLCSMYNVPCVLTNWVPIGWPLWLRQDLVLPKLFRSKKTGQYLSLDQTFEENLAFIQNWSSLPEHVELVANTPDELAKAALEMLTQCGVDCGLVSLDEADYSRALKRYEQIAKFHGSYTGSRLARTFLEKHPEYLQSSKPALIERKETDKLRLLA